MTLGASEKTCLGDSVDLNLSLCVVKEDFRKMETFFSKFLDQLLIKMRSYYKHFVNFSNFVNIKLMIAEAYLEPSRIFLLRWNKTG